MSPLPWVWAAGHPPRNSVWTAASSARAAALATGEPVRTNITISEGGRPGSPRRGPASPIRPDATAPIGATPSPALTAATSVAQLPPTNASRHGRWAASRCLVATALTPHGGLRVTSETVPSSGVPD